MSCVTRPLMRLLACWLLLTSVGCATLNLRNMDLRSRKATARNPVTRVVCLWEPAEGRDPQGNPCHGFAGNILFLNSSSLPVSVDGDVRIYLFDDQGTVEEQSEPLHKFDFDSGAWTRHYSYGTLGPAYNVFIPYMRKGAYEANCALRLRLTPKAGPPVFSDMTSIELMSFHGGGKSSPKKTQVDSRVEAATAEDLTSVNNRRRTTTISLPAGGSVESPLAGESENEIQLAAYEEEPRPLTSADSKIAQLEQMVKELREQQRLQFTESHPPAANAVRGTAPPRRLDETVEEPARVRTRSLAPSQESTSTEAKSPAATRFTIRPAKSASAAAHHPLEDDDQAVAISRPKAHPLLEDDAPVARRGTQASSPAARHPLEDVFEEQPAAPARTATRKIIPAEGSSYGQDRGRSVDPFVDPFEPIEIDTIETTAVDERQTSRRQLRSVNH